ncbi:hypothetical protein BDW66DRAFT_163524 [Aspergillus desertorum]
MATDKVPRFTHFSCQTLQTQKTSRWEELAPGFDSSNWKPAAGIWWLDVCDATAADVVTVARSLSVHPLTVEDIALQEQRQKIETFPAYYLISLRTLSTTPDEGSEPEQQENLPPAPSDVAMVYILLFSEGTVTFSPSGCEHATRVRSRISRLHDRSVLSSDWISLPIYDTISRQSSIRKRINHLTHSLSGKSDVLNGFLKRCQTKALQHTFPEGDLLVYLSDVQDHLVTILAELAHLDEITSRLQSNFLARTGVNNMRLSVRLNDGLSKMITGLSGMNVTVPGQDIESLAWFFGIVGVFVSVIVIACFVAVRLRLL